MSTKKSKELLSEGEQAAKFAGLELPPASINDVIAGIAAEYDRLHLEADRWRQRGRAHEGTELQDKCNAKAAEYTAEATRLLEENLV